MSDVRLTKEQLDTMITAAAKAGAEAALAGFGAGTPTAAQPAHGRFEDASPDEQFTAMMRERRGQHLPPLPTNLHKCKSHVTGATFDAIVDHKGIVAEIPNYEIPEKAKLSEVNGGVVPDGIPMLDRVSGKPHKLYSKWLWETYWREDLRTFVGKPLPKYALIEFAETMTAPPTVAAARAADEAKESKIAGEVAT